MTDQDVINDLLSYLKETFKIREFSENTRLQGFIDGYDRDSAEFTVTPWDIEQITLNTGLHDSQGVEDIISANPGSFSLEDLPGKLTVVRISSEESLETKSSKNGCRVNTGSITVEDAFKWYLYYKIGLLSENGNRPVSISDGVFSIKNELFLPDDFVPPVMMEMVEGSKIVDVVETRKKLQPSGQENAILLLAKHDSGRFLEPHSFYFRSSLCGEVPANMESLGGKISNSFAEFQTSVEYEDFLFSRVMRNVIFTLEVKKKRELGKPLFDPGKLRLLEKRRIVRLEGDVGVIPDSVELNELKRLKSSAEEKAANVSETWMSSRIRL